ncbi:MAG TPA: hypothetical protein VEN79_09925 [Terriglobia bacterium]|nr:hypothetical protein [Terriglobia bacterium]
MYQRCLVASILVLFADVWMAQGDARLHITHQYANTNAQSLIGLPMGDHKTIVDQQGSLHWSQWSLKRRGLDVPFGFSEQMDGTVDLRLFLGTPADPPAPLKVIGQELYRGRFPFVVTHLEAGELRVEEVAFSSSAPRSRMDVIRVRCRNEGSTGLSVVVRLSAKQRNLPAFVNGSALATRDGYLVALAQSETGAFSSEIGGLELDYRVDIPADRSITLWVKTPYDLLMKDQPLVASLRGEDLLNGAENFWRDFWGHGMKIDLPEKELADFYYSSLAYVFVLTERDAQGDLWTLDGPGMYVHYWGRGEYFQARAMEVAGYLDIARQTVEHSLRLQRDDGEWDWPAISGWPAWDSIGGNAGSVWDCYRFSRDRAWLERAYPPLLAAARWIDYHREETELPANTPPGAQPIRRQIPWSCMKEPEPLLQPGEKPYWWGLLPWGYGDSGLPEGHAFPHNVMALYEVDCARKAAEELGRTADAKALAAEYADFRQAILTSMRRAISLEKNGPPYLPAMPTYPQAALSQSLLAVYPAELLAPNDPWVTGLLARIEHSELQGLPSNMAWLGSSGVWPGESLNVAETYLRRGDIEKSRNMLIAALNHSYTTNVWKEEIRVDRTLPVACVDNAPNHRDIPNGEGTGDMPEAWGNANLVNLVRDMLLREDGSNLYLLSGFPADWIAVGDAVSVQGAPTTDGGHAASFRLTYPKLGSMALTVTPPGESVKMIARFPIGEGRSITSASVNGKPVKGYSGSQLRLDHVTGAVDVKVTF